MPECVKCGQEVVRRGWFWVLVTEAEQRMVTRCPGGDGINHEVEDEDDDG